MNFIIGFAGIGLFEELETFILLLLFIGIIGILPFAC